MPTNRSSGRDVHIYDEHGPTLLGGLILANGVTNSNFYSMVEIILQFQEAYTIRRGNSTTVERNDEALTPGDYYVIGKLLILITIELLAHSLSIRVLQCERRNCSYTYAFYYNGHPYSALPRRSSEARSRMRHNRSTSQIST